METNYLDGLDVLSANPGAGETVFGGWQGDDTDVLGAASSWSNANSYAAGDHVLYGYNEYVATAQISPPMLPSIESGEVPGQSAYWALVKPTNVWGEEIFGFDIASSQLKMNALTPVTVGDAQIILKTAQQVINDAIYKANSLNLPGPTARQNVADHLAWHANALKSAGAPSAVYASGEDLKKYCMQAFIESNAVDEGSATLLNAWTQMWSDMGTNAVNFGKGTVKTAEWTVAAVVVGAGVLLYLVYNILRGPIAQQAIGTYVGTKAAQR